MAQATQQAISPTQQAIPPTQQPGTEGWTLVTRRRRPAHFLPGAQSPPRRTTPLNLRSPTYAQVVRSGPNPPASTQMTKTPTYIRSPSSPTNLRYPPNPHFKEWWGRCFRCAKKRHIVAECKLPRAHATGQNSVNLAEHCDPEWLSSSSNASQATQQQPSEQKRTRAEPTFEEFLAQPEPQEEPYMPSLRPAKAICYFNRDDQYFQTCKKLSSAIVIQPPRGKQPRFSLDQAADLVAASKKLSSNQLQVGRLSGDRFLAVLPSEMNRDEVVAAIPTKTWEDGFILQPYSSSMDADISIPFFKVWVDIKGVPLELYTEDHMARVISSFGIYLGSMEPRTVGDCQTWSVFLATDDLALVPYQVDIRVGGMIHTAQVCPRKWTKGQVYKHSDLPPISMPYSPPTDPMIPARGNSQKDHTFSQEWFQGDDVMRFSLTALREIFRHTPLEELPAEFAACLAGDTQAIAANHDAHRKWVLEEARRGRPDQNQDIQATQRSATLDPSHRMLHSSAPEQPSPVASQPRPQAHPVTVSTSHTFPAATVHRTDLSTSRGKRTHSDLALQVCTLQSNQNLEPSQGRWEPSDLFPEIHAQPSQDDNPTDNRGTEHDEVPIPIKAPLLVRTLRGRVNKKKTGEAGTLELDVQNFVDVPLQIAEGKELLALIGAASIPIPSHIMNSSQQQRLNIEVGQPSKVPKRKKKQNGPSPGPSAHNEGPASNLDAQERGNPATQQIQGIPHRPTTADMDPMAVDNPSVPDDQAEQADDPYLDTVDYSDEDLLPN